MAEDIKVHFVCFETTLDSELFMKRWKEFNRSSYSDMDVTLQKSKKNNLFLYIAQHRFETKDQQFEFAKEPKSTRVVQERIKTTIAGGYVMLRPEFRHEATMGESKIFIFLADAKTDLTAYKTMPVSNKLNIYKAYYENCGYAYILEYFVKNKHAVELTEHLKKYDSSETGIYREYAHIKNPEPQNKEGRYVWPA